MPICEMVRNAMLRTRFERMAVAATRAMIFVRNRPPNQFVGDDELERAVGRLQQSLRNGHALLLVGVEQRWIGAALHDERELPCEVVGILQPRVHALGAHRAVDVRGVAEKEAAPVAEPFRGAVMDAVGREPAARLERERRSRLLADRGNQLLERQDRPSAAVAREVCR